MILLCAALLLPSCGRNDLSGPPTIRLAKDECAACGMLINEERCSCALLISRNGSLEYATFDDIGCMLDFEKKSDAGSEIRDRFFHDHDTKQWLREPEATFLTSDPTSLRTPMGSGMVAFSNRTAAEAARKQFGGDVLAFAQLSLQHQDKAKPGSPEGK